MFENQKHKHNQPYQDFVFWCLILTCNLIFEGKQYCQSSIRSKTGCQRKS